MRSLRSAVGGGIALTASLLLARVHPFGNARLDAAGPGSAIMQDPSVPADVRAALTAKCADCHSTATRLPAYNRIAARLAPASWLIERDMVEGRKGLDLSAWDSYSSDQQQILMAKILEQAKERKMPLPQYRMIHWKARVTDADVLTFARWVGATQTSATPATRMGVEQAPGAGDPIRGRQVFEKRCTGCHALDQSREGPRLRDVFGRTSGQVAGFPYSPALVKARIVWNQASLERWLTDTDMFVPGNNMDFSVPKQQERQDLIQFLKETSGR